MRAQIENVIRRCAYHLLYLVGTDTGVMVAFTAQGSWILDQLHPQMLLCVEPAVLLVLRPAMQEGISVYVYVYICCMCMAAVTSAASIESATCCVSVASLCVAAAGASAKLTPLADMWVQLAHLFSPERSCLMMQQIFLVLLQLAIQV